MRTGLAILLLAALLPAQDWDDEEEYYGPLDGRLAPGDPVRPAIRVRLDEGSGLRARADGRWEPMTLDALGEHFKQRIRADDTAQRKIGKSGLELRDGVTFSRLFVHLEAHPKTPWQHVGWVLTVCMERRLQKVHLRVGKRAINVVLPIDRSVHDAEPPPRVFARVHVLGRGAVEERWGAFTVQRPETVTYRIGDRTTDDLAEVTRYLAATHGSAVDAGKTGILYGVFRADYKVPVDRAVDVLLAFVDAGITQGGDWFYGRLPTKAERKRYWLPYPTRDRG